MKSITAIYFLTLFYAFHYSLPLYSESSYLESLVGVQWVGLVYSISAIFSFVAVVKIGKLLNVFGNRKLLMLSIILEAVSLLVLAVSSTVAVSIVAFIIHLVLLSVIFVGINILLESISTNESTGRVRGVFLTILNLGILTGPFFAAQLIGEDLRALFILGALCLLPVVYILRKYFSKTQEPKYVAPSFFDNLSKLKELPDIRRIVTVQFILELFYIVMIIYAPIYLIKNDITDLVTYLGVIIPIVLIPFIVLPYPLGRLADSRLGEKELLILGLLLMIFGTTIFSLLSVPILSYYVFALFLARLGASMVEEMTSSYFYKQIDASQSDLIGIFTNTRNIAIIVGPLMGSILIYSFSLNAVFWGLLSIMTISLFPLLKLHDTK